MNTYSKLLGLSLFALALLAPVDSLGATKLFFTGTGSGYMYLSAPAVASGTVVLPALSGGTSYLIDGTRKISTTSPLLGGGALAENLSLSLDLRATYEWKGVHDSTEATSILPNSLGLPLTCLAGSVYVNLSGASSQKLFVCETTDAWVAVGVSQASTNLPNNFTAVADPTINDDAEYAVGSRWLNTIEDTQFVAVSVDSGTARWFRTDIGNARFSGSRKGEVLDLNYYNVAGASTSDLATQINFWTNSYASPGNTTSDATIARAAGDNGTLSVTNRGAGDITLFSGDDVYVYLDTDDTSDGGGSFVIVGSDTGSAISAVYENGTQYLISDFAEGGTSSSYPLFISRFQDTTAGVACTTGSCVGGMRAGDSCTVVADCLMTDNNQHLMKLSAYGQGTTSAGDATYINTGAMGFQVTEDWVRGACSSTTATKCTIDSQCPVGAGNCSSTTGTSCTVNSQCPSGETCVNQTYEYCANSSVGTDFYIRTSKEQHMQTRFVLYGSEGSATSNSGIWTAGSSTQQVQPTGGDPGPGVALRQDGRLVAYSTGSIQADKLNSSVTADGAVSVATGTNSNFTIDPNGTGIVIVNSVGLRTIHTTPSAATHWIGRDDSHGLLFNQSTSYSPVLQSTTNVDVLVDSNNSGGGVTHSFNVKADAISGGDSKLIASFGQNLAAIKPDGTNGVSMTGAGLLAKAGTGSIVADKASNNGALTIETTASDGDIKLTPHGSGQVIVYGDTPTGQVGASGTMVITDDDTIKVQLALTSNLVGTTTPSTLNMLKRNGTTSTVAGEQLSRITSYGYENVGTADNKIAGTIGFDANEAFNDSQAGSNFVLGLTGDGANTLETRFKILGDGTSEWTTNGSVGVQMDANGRLTRRPAGGRIEATDVSFGTVSSDDTACTTGEVKFDATYTYFCVDGSSASQKWKRIAMSSDTW